MGEIVKYGGGVRYRVQILVTRVGYSISFFANFKKNNLLIHSKPIKFQLTIF